MDPFTLHWAELVLAALIVFSVGMLAGVFAAAVAIAPRETDGMPYREL